MSTTAIRLLRVLFDASSRDLKESNAYFAKQLGCSERTVCRALAQLARRGLIEIEHTRASGPGEVARNITVASVQADELLSRVAAR